MVRTMASLELQNQNSYHVGALSFIFYIFLISTALVYN